MQYNQFARSLATAALDQQRRLRDACWGLSNEITSYAKQANATWPFVFLPYFESYGKGFFAHSHAEFIGVQNIVKDEDRDAFINWTTAHFKEWLEESHMIQYGHLDFLNTDPAKYNEYIARRDKEKTFPPDDERPFYAVRVVQSPPMRAYGPTMNLNIATIPGIADMHAALFALKNETIVTKVKPFDAVPPEEHQNFHTDSEADNPHSFLYTPIWRDVQDPESGIVGSLSSSVAWDASMLNLLPKTVRGIDCVVYNNCGQTLPTGCPDLMPTFKVTETITILNLTT